MPVYAKTVSSWVRKVLGIARIHVPGAIQGAVVSVTVVTGVS